MQRSRVPSAPLGSWLLGSTDESPRRRRIRVQALLTAPLLVTNLIGAVLAIVLVGFVVPGPEIIHPEFAWINFIAVPVFIGCVFLIGLLWGTNASCGISGGPPRITGQPSRINARRCAGRGD
ncbi:hypothetical protein GCM10020255_093060 [Rhodococcus baikonurensis]